MRTDPIRLMLLLSLATACERSAPEPPPEPPRLYWFIPDGLRADPELFRMFEWARAGELPHIRTLMDRGAWGYSVPDFPSHTPTNFASLLTGRRPLGHGVADGPMHTEGAVLSRPSIGGFSSAAKRAPPVWKLLEARGKRVALLSVPGSTPPELNGGIIVRGRWGGWGADTPAVIFEPAALLPQRKEAGKAFKLFFLGQRLTEFVQTRAADGWALKAGGPAIEATLAAFGLTLYAHVSDSTDDGVRNYDTVRISPDRKDVWWTLRAGEQSDWHNVQLTFGELPYASQARLRVIKIWPKEGWFRLRLFFNNANRFNTVPAKVAAELTEDAGPMVDFADNWPPQLVYEPEDEAVFLAEAKESLAWHARAAGAILSRYKPDAFIHDVYTPNQMLESRWWHRHVDPKRPGYDPARAERALEDLKILYRGVDAVVGEAINRLGENDVIVLSSDHGVIPLYKQVRLNNLFAQMGWLKFSIDPASGEPAIDWPQTRVIYLKMNHVYINPAGLAGPYRRASGSAYERLRREVMGALSALKDTDGTAPLVKAVGFERAPDVYHLPSDRVGDIVLEIEPGYTWWEEVTAGGEIFTEPLTSGYKQAVNARKTPGMWTPFVIAGPGVKPGTQLTEPISHVDQLPTILRLLGLDAPKGLEGRVLDEILDSRR